jgi:outer membrane immunogenic protein
MKNTTFGLGVAALALFAAAPAFAQDASTDSGSIDAGSPAANVAAGAAPDGTAGFGFKPYVGVLGGYHSFDSRKSGPPYNRAGIGNGAVIQGVVGANIPLGPGFVGVEGNAAKDFHELDWEYGLAGRVGFRAGDSGLIYGKAGYQWVEFDGPRKREGVLYGIGAEVGPKDLGLGGVTGNAGIRLRFDLDTVEFKSFKPMAGIVFHL